MLGRLIDDESGAAATASPPARRARSTNGRSRSRHGASFCLAHRRAHHHVVLRLAILVILVIVGLVPQFGQRVSQVLGVYLLVGRALEAHLPVMWRARWRADEKELASVRQGQALCLGGGTGIAERCGPAIVDLANGAQYALAIPDGTDASCILG